MSDKQRADHVQAKYWNGFITRTEAQKVFDEYAQAQTALSIKTQQLDAVVSFLAERAGVSAEDINTWVKVQIEKAAKATQAQENGLAQVCGERPASVLVDA